MEALQALLEGVTCTLRCYLENTPQDGVEWALLYSILQGHWSSKGIV